MQKNFQTIEQGGILRSYVTMPTVRSINAQFLVRAKNQAELDLTLQRIVEWLDCGEAKLQTREMTGVYYKAAYSEISSPTYSGSSCKFSVTFQCSDYRLYSESNDKPLEGADPGTENFTFNGKHCLNDMNCMFVLESKSVVPPIRLHKYEVPGIAGTLRYGDFTLGERKISGSLYLVNNKGSEPLSFAEQDRRLRRIAEWLISAKRASFIWDSEPAYVYEAEIEDEASFSRTDWRNGKIDVTFAVQPNATRKNYSTLVVEDKAYGRTYSNINLGEMIDVDTGNPMTFNTDTPLHIEIENTSTGDYRKRITRLAIQHYADNQEGGEIIFGETGNLALFTLDPGQKLIINTDTRRAYVNGGRPVNTQGSFPFVAPSDPRIRIAMHSYELEGGNIKVDGEGKPVAATSVNCTITITARGAVH